MVDQGCHHPSRLRNELMWLQPCLSPSFLLLILFARWKEDGGEDIWGHLVISLWTAGKQGLSLSIQVAGIGAEENTTLVSEFSLAHPVNFNLTTPPFLALVFFHKAPRFFPLLPLRPTQSGAADKNHLRDSPVIFFSVLPSLLFHLILFPHLRPLSFPRLAVFMLGRAF